MHWGPPLVIKINSNLSLTNTIWHYHSQKVYSENYFQRLSVYDLNIILIHTCVVYIYVLTLLDFVVMTCSHVSVPFYHNQQILWAIISSDFSPHSHRNTGFLLRMPPTSSPCTRPPSTEWRTWSAWATSTKPASSATCSSATMNASSMSVPVVTTQMFTLTV